jgi:hypothetical protein
MPTLDGVSHAERAWQTDRLRAAIGELVDRCIWEADDKCFARPYLRMLEAVARLPEAAADPRLAGLRTRFERVATARDLELASDIGMAGAGDAYA